MILIDRLLGDHPKAAICYHLKTGLYEKVIKVKADVAAVLVSATQRFWGSGGEHCQGRRFFGVHLDP